MPTSPGAPGRARELARRLSPFREPRTAADWVVDGLLFAVALTAWLLYGFAFAEAMPAIPDWFWPLDRVLGLALCLALWWSRSHPVAVAVLGLVPGAVAVSAALAVLLAVYRLGMYARPRVSALVTLAHIALAVPYHAVLPLPGMSWEVWLVVIPLLYLLALSFGLLARARRLVLEGVRAEAARDRERFGAQLAGARRAERERIAREMHDVLAHRISLVSVHAGALEHRTAEGESAPGAREIHETAGVIRRNAHLAAEELRQVLAVLRDEDEDARVERRPQPRLLDLDRLVAEAGSAGQRVELRVDPEAAGLAEAAQRTVYRVVQEGLTNARKHAPSAAVRVEVRAFPGRVTVRVANPAPVGVTGRQIPGAGAGLTGLAERVRIDGGTLRHGIEEGSFELVAALPRRAS